jgi:hypothetical protein
MPLSALAGYIRVYLGFFLALIIKYEPTPCMPYSLPKLRYFPRGDMDKTGVGKSLCPFLDVFSPLLLPGTLTDEKG